MGSIQGTHPRQDLAAIQQAFPEQGEVYYCLL